MPTLSIAVESSRRAPIFTLLADAVAALNEAKAHVVADRAAVKTAAINFGYVVEATGSRDLVQGVRRRLGARLKA
jgi:hypothetical protein